MVSKKEVESLILAVLEGIYNSLGESEKLVADYVIKRPDDVIHYSITEFSMHCKSSEATIYRLCRKIGFDGYQQFKIALARELTSPIGSFASLKNGKDFSGFVDTIFDESIEVLENTRRLLDMEKLQKSVSIILNSKRLLFFGVGRSAPMAKDGSLRFAILGFHTVSYSDPHAQVMVGAGLTKFDVVVGISHSGAIRDTVKSLEIARDRGAKTIAITAGLNSPITEIADITLYCAAGKEHLGNFLNNRIGEFVVMNVLYRSVLSKMEKEMSSHLDNLYNKILKPKRFEK